MNKKLNKLVAAFGFLMLVTTTSWSQNVASKPDVETLVKGYLAAWRESDHLKREKLLAEVWAPNGVYTDSQAEVKGRQKVVEHIGLAMQVVPSNRIVEVSNVESHHGTFRFAWRSVMPDGTVLNEGMDFGEVDSKGRIRRLAVFFGPLVPKPEVK